MNFRLLLKG